MSTRVVAICAALLLALASAWFLATGSLADDGRLNDVQTKAALQQKLSMEQSIEAAAAAARARPQPIKAPKPATKNVTVPWPGGIFESAQAPFPPALYRIQNQWQGQIGSEYVQVFAGAKGSDSEQGVIVVLTTSVTDLTDHSRQTGGLYLTPGRFGNVHISAATGTELTLATPDGKTFRFDVASRLLAMP